MTHPARAHSSLLRRLDGPELVEPRRRTSKTILRVEVTNDAGHWILEPDGEIDLSNAAVLEQAIWRAEASDADTITIDLDHVAFIDLCGVRAILDAHARLEGRLRLREGPAAVQSVFRLTGTQAELPFEPGDAEGADR